MNFNDIPCTMVEEFLCFLIFNIENFFSYSICLDAPHLTNKHSAQNCIASGRWQFCILPVYNPGQNSLAKT